MRTVLFAFVVAAVLAPSGARAEGDSLVRAHLEASASHFLPVGDAWQAREIGYGFVGAGAVELRLHHRFGIEARLTSARFLGGDAPADPNVQPTSVAGFLAMTVGLRVQLASRGPWLGAGFGSARTGTLSRPVWDARVGWDFSLADAIAMGPFLGYFQVIERDSGSMRPEDARAFMIGLHGSFGGGASLGPKPLDRAEHKVVIVQTSPLPEPKMQTVDVTEGGPRVVADHVAIDERIYFEFGLAAVRSDSWSALFELAKFLLAHPELGVIEIQGHTDEVGDDASNQQLSEDRAAAVRAKLIEYGVPAARLVSKGYGKRVPVVQGSDEESRQKNRRVEFVLQSMTGGAP